MAGHGENRADVFLPCHVIEMFSLRIQLVTCAHPVCLSAGPCAVQELHAGKDAGTGRTRDSQGCKQIYVLSRFIFTTQETLMRSDCVFFLHESKQLSGDKTHCLVTKQIFLDKYLHIIVAQVNASGRGVDQKCFCSFGHFHLLHENTTTIPWKHYLKKKKKTILGSQICRAKLLFNSSIQLLKLSGRFLSEAT